MFNCINLIQSSEASVWSNINLHILEKHHEHRWTVDDRMKIGHYLMNEVRYHLKFGSNNRDFDLLEPERYLVSLVNFNIAKVSNLCSMESTSGSVNWSNLITHFSRNAEMFEYGNCGWQSSWIFKRAIQMGLKSVCFLSLIQGDHAFILLGDYLDKSDRENWVILDSHGGEIYRYRDIEHSQLTHLYNENADFNIECRLFDNTSTLHGPFIQEHFTIEEAEKIPFYISQRNHILAHSNQTQNVFQAFSLDVIDSTDKLSIREKYVHKFKELLSHLQISLLSEVIVRIYDLFSSPQAQLEPNDELRNLHEKFYQQIIVIRNQYITDYAANPPLLFSCIETLEKYNQAERDFLLHCTETIENELELPQFKL